MGSRTSLIAGVAHGQNFFVVPDDFKEAAELQEEEEKAQTAATTGDSDSDDDADLHV